MKNLIKILPLLFVLSCGGESTFYSNEVCTVISRIKISNRLDDADTSRIYRYTLNCAHHMSDVEYWSDKKYEQYDVIEFNGTLRLKK